MNAAEIDSKLAFATDDQIELLIQHRNDPHPPAEVPVAVVKLGLSGTFNFWGPQSTAGCYRMDDQLRKRLGEIAKRYSPTHRRSS